MVRARWSVAVVALLVAVGAAGPAAAAPDDLDPGFGGDGRVFTDVTPRADQAEAIALQDDGKLLVGGSAGGRMVVARYLEDGTLDATFGVGGVTTLDITPDRDRVMALALDSEGRIVAGGSGRFDNLGFVVRLRPDGRPDPEFSGNGRLVLPARGSWATEVRDLVLDGEDGVVLGGIAVDDRGLDRMMVVRLDADGVPRPGFGVAGRVVLPRRSPNGEHVMAIALDGSGRIVLAAKFDQEPSIVDRMGAARLWPGGRVDRTFGTAGRVRLPFETHEEAGLVMDGDELVIGGMIDGNTTLVRLGPDGSLVHRRDADTFGADWGVDLVPEGTGGHLVVGWDYRGRNHRVAVVRYDADDQVDRSFGLEGVALVEVTPGQDHGTGIVVDEQGRYVVAVHLGRRLGVIRLVGRGPGPSLTG